MRVYLLTMDCGMFPKPVPIGIFDDKDKVSQAIDELKGGKFETQMFELNKLLYDPIVLNTCVEAGSVGRLEKSLRKSMRLIKSQRSCDA